MSAIVTEIVAGVYLLSGFLGAGVWGANVYLLVDDGDLTLVDTGFLGRADRILEQIKELGYSPADVKRIIITHHHVDHIGSLAELKGVTQAEVIAHPADAPYIDGSLPQPGPAVPQWLSKPLARFSRLWSTEPAAVDILVSDGDELPIMGGIKILHTPGHTPGSICLYLQDRDLLIAGDLLANRFGLRLPSRGFTVDTVQEAQSIKRVAGLEFDIICFGHGSPIMHNAHQAVADFADSLTESHGSAK
ncbi:MAG: MBL fold metallo-hydrolase [Dehalococcoidia bacterium]|nr:MBL fold metallo-hydrolase [Dehalococcoidia bacterium]